MNDKLLEFLSNEMNLTHEDITAKTETQSGLEELVGCCTDIICEEAEKDGGDDYNAERESMAEDVLRAVGGTLESLAKTSQAAAV